MTENTAALPAAERPGTPALPQDLIDVDALLEAYRTGHPDVCLLYTSPSPRDS